MKYIAFRRAKNTVLYNEIKLSMPAEYIIEHHVVENFPKDYFNLHDGWEIENEDYFNQEIAKNPDVINSFKARQHELTVDERRILKEELIKEYIKDKDEYALYCEFKEWKKRIKQHKYLHQINNNHI
jgi:hypothetical protein